jgi:hypothetical protein
VQDGAVLLALAEDGARVRIPASFGQATAQRSSGDTVEMGGFVVQVTNPRGAVGLHVPGEEDASQALLAATIRRTASSWMSSSTQRSTRHLSLALPWR